MSKKYGVFLALAVFVFTGPAMAGDCPVDFSYQLRGSSFDNSAYAWFKTSYVYEEESPTLGPTLEGVFGLPRYDRSTATFSDFILCVTDGKCRTWRVLGAKDFDWGSQSARLDDIRTAVSDSKVLFNRNHTAVRNKASNALLIPKSVMVQFAVPADVILQTASTSRVGDCSLDAFAEGFGKATVESFSTAEYGVGNCTAQAHLGPAYVTIDNAFLFFIQRGYCEVSKARDMRVAVIAARLHNGRAYQEHKQKDYAAASEGFAKAFDLDPKFAQSAFNLACAKARLGATEESISALRKAIALDRDTFLRKAEKDEDLASIRQHPEFKKLLK